MKLLNTNTPFVVDDAGRKIIAVQNPDGTSSGVVFRFGNQLYTADGDTYRNINNQLKCPSVCFIGDSITAPSMLSTFGPPNKRPLAVEQSGGSNIVNNLSSTLSVNFRTVVYVGFTKSVVGAGTFDWNQTTKTLRLATDGAGYGAGVVVDKSGFYTVYNAARTKFVYFSALSTFSATTATYSFDTSTDPFRKKEFGYFGYGFRWLLDKLDYGKVYNLGITGDTPAGVLGRVDDIKQCGADINVLLIGANASTQIVETEQIIDYMVRLPGQVIVSLLTPAAGGHVAITKFNNEIRDYCQVNYPNVIIVDPTKYLYAADQVTPDSHKFREVSSLHPNGIAAKYVTQCFPVDLIQQGTEITPRANDLYNAATNPRGNLITTPTIETNFAYSDANWSGVFPTGWGASRTGTTQIGVGSVTAHTDGSNKEYWTATLSNGNGAGLSWFNMNTNGVLTAGDILSFKAKIRIRSAIGLVLAYFQIGDDTGNWRINFTMNPTEVVTGLNPDFIDDWVIISAPELMHVGATSGPNLQVYFYMRTLTGGSAVIDVDWIDMRKVFP